MQLAVQIPVTREGNEVIAQVTQEGDGVTFEIPGPPRKSSCTFTIKATDLSQAQALLSVQTGGPTGEPSKASPTEPSEPKAAQSRSAAKGNAEPQRG